MSDANRSLQAFFGQASRPDKELLSPGTETEWMAFLTVDFKGSQLLVSDASAIPSKERGLRIELTKGRYCILVKGIDYGFEHRLSRVRYFREGAAFSLGGRLGDTCTDSALTGFWDLGSIPPAFDESEMSRAMEEAISAIGRCGVMTLMGASVPVVSGGVGDGSFPVYELTWQSSRVGIEVEFIKAGTKYPEMLYFGARQEWLYKMRAT